MPESGTPAYNNSYKTYVDHIIHNEKFEGYITCNDVCISNTRMSVSNGSTHSCGDTRPSDSLR